MRRKSALQELQNAVSDCEISILYKPIKDELDYSSPLFPLEIKPSKVVLPCDKNADPFLWVKKCKSVCKNTNSYILIPGNKFDMHGTRHGKGGGWYDRFLSKTPKTWLKIGIADQSQISPMPIKRESWDMPVDWLLIRDTNNTWSVHKTSTQLEA